MAACETTLLSRLGTLLWLKSIGSTVAISVFFVLYFYVLNNPVFPVVEMPLLALDRYAPVVPWSAWIYFSLWIYICIPSSLMVLASELGHYLMGAAILSIIGLSIFFLLPTAVPVWEIDWGEYPRLEFLKKSDAAGNACPSLHVAFSVYAGLALSRMIAILEAYRLWSIGNWVWCGLIVLSTITTKQHVFIDVLSGGVLGFVVYLLNARFACRAGLIGVRC